MKAKKNFGQNWLIDETVISDIVNASIVSKNATQVLEIGPGTANLTRVLLENEVKVTAIEKDRELIADLTKMFGSYEGNFNLVQSDIRDLDICQLNLGSYQVVANIPYYITGWLIRNFLESNCQPESMTLLIQREVADRIIATDEKESLLSLSVKAYSEKVFKVRNVKAGAFRPIPSVDSAVIRIEGIGKEFFKENNLTPEKFFKVIRKAFNQKRKTLGSTLGIAHLSWRSRRPQDLKLQDWVEVISLLS